MQDLAQAILDALKAAGRPLSVETIKLETREGLDDAINSLVESNSIVFTKRRKLALPSHMGLTLGRVQGHARGFAFFIPDSDAPDAFIPADSMRGAMHSDKVFARYTGQQSRNGSPEADIGIIVERGYKEVVGTFEAGNRAGAYVVPDDLRISSDMLILRDKTKKAQPGDKVVVKIIEYPSARRPMLGEVTEILGHKDAAGTDVLSVIRQFQLPDTFSKGALRQARLVSKSISEDEAVTRENLVNKLVFTIDGADAKDLDDAISLERLKNGNLYLGVHIADVAHYVREGSPLDKDALERGTSVYLVDRVVPMLPAELSNGICSLNPGEDRLTLSCFMEIDAQGRVRRHRLSETIINSRHRLIYDDVTKLLGGDEALLEKYADIAPTLKELEALCLNLNARRVKRGSIDFDIAQARIELDTSGMPTNIEREERGIANRIIEECMLLANETVATHMYDMSSPFIYRVHERPGKEKLTDLNAFLQTLGYGIRSLRDVHPRAVQRVLENAKGTKEENIVSKVVLRAMQKARYSESCLGHFGLALEKYCHFTSPIRRYPDLMAHRIVKHMLHGELNERLMSKFNAKLPSIAEQCSIRERVAMEAERAVDDIKKCQYMKGRIGESFAGIISGVASYGFFVELANTVEGRVRLTNLDDDHYIVEEKSYRLVGRDTGKILRMGDEISLRLLSVNMISRNIEFEPSKETV